jgi:hypothetical protein
MIHHKVVLKIATHYKQRFWEQMDIIKYNNNNYRNQVDLERIVIQTKWKTDFYKADNYNKDKQCKITIIK